MADQALLDRVKELIADICAIDAAGIQDNGRLLGYGLDSVRALDLLFALEDEVGAEISEHDPELREIKTVAQLADFVERRRK